MRPVPARMAGHMRLSSGEVTFRLDLHRGRLLGRHAPPAKGSTVHLCIRTSEAYVFLAKTGDRVPG
jgi:hypothetical protein